MLALFPLLRTHNWTWPSKPYSIKAVLPSRPAHSMNGLEQGNSIPYRSEGEALTMHQSLICLHTRELLRNRRLNAVAIRLCAAYRTGKAQSCTWESPVMWPNCSPRHHPILMWWKVHSRRQAVICPHWQTDIKLTHLLCYPLRQKQDLSNFIPLHRPHNHRRSQQILIDLWRDMSPLIQLTLSLKARIDPRTIKDK